VTNDGRVAVIVGAVHELKTWPEHYEAIISGAKRFEARRDDRGYAVGDELHLREWDPTGETYTGRSTYVTVLHKLVGGSFGIEPGHCVMSISDPIPTF
jgi:hypothetical protein